MRFLKMIGAELYKTKHTFLPWIHIIIPIVYVILAILTIKYTSVKNISQQEVVIGYFAVMTSVLPLLISIITSKAVDLEQNAGNFLSMFSSYKSKKIAFFVKLLVLVVCGTFSISLTTMLFAKIYGSIELFIYIFSIILLSGCTVSLYIMHLTAAFRFGSGATIGLGIVEMLVSLLFVTGLGDKLWYFLPCAWGTRLSANLISMYFDKFNMIYYFEIRKCILFAFPFTICLFILSLFWFSKFEGRNDSE